MIPFLCGNKNNSFFNSLHRYQRNFSNNEEITKSVSNIRLTWDTGNILRIEFKQKYISK